MISVDFPSVDLVEVKPTEGPYDFELTLTCEGDEWTYGDVTAKLSRRSAELLIKKLQEALDD